ncbi:MAG: ABC transporter substrate-binding protein [Clostridiales bacterium]|nr:ABC transporter substrate-binding protein [Clostridiales bacterium]
MKKFIKLLAVVLLVASLPFVYVSAEDADMTVRVGGLKGPTGMALAHIMTENDGTYEFTLAGAPTELSAAVIKGDVDIAAVPVNLGAVLYNKTQGGVKGLSLITRGMLFVLEKGDTIKTVADLEGKNIAAAGQGSTPEYVTRYILETNNVNANVEFFSEHAEVTTRALSGMANVILVPEPHVTNVLMKDSSFRVALNITEEFAAAAQKNGYADAQLSMSVVIVRTEFYEKHPELVADFLKDLEASIAFTTENVAQAAQEIAAQGIIPAAAVAEKALPNCQLVFISGEAMQAQAAPLYDILFSANPSSVGGKVPDDAFYAK